MFPSGSKIKFEPAINGVGMKQNDWESWEKKGRGLNQCSRANQNKLFWVSHTWTHQHLDWLNGDECGGKESMLMPSLVREGWWLVLWIVVRLLGRTSADEADQCGG